MAIRNDGVMCSQNNVAFKPIQDGSAVFTLSNGLCGYGLVSSE